MRVLVFLLLFAALPLLSSSVSSEQAKEVAKAYLLQGEVAVIGQYNPLEVGSDKFWLLYVAPQDAPKTKNLVVVVRDEGEIASLETREETLKELHGIDFDVDLLSFIQERKVSYDDLEKTLQAVKAKVSSNARPGLDRIEAQQSSYPDLSFEDVSSLLRDLEDEAERAEEKISDGRSYQTTFAQTFFASDLRLALDGYDDAFDGLSALVKAAESYHKAVDEKQKEVSKAGLPLEVASTLSKSLDAIRDVGIDESFESGLLSPSRREYENRLSRKDSQVNDSIRGFYFRKAKVEAQKAYSDSLARTYSPEALLSPRYKVDLESCALSTRELKGKWLAVKQVMLSASATTEEYSKIPFAVDEANALAESVAGKLEKCINAPPTTTPRPVTKPTDYTTPILFVAFVGVAGYFAYRFMQQRGAQEEEE